jgi:hypothetical protein
LTVPVAANAGSIAWAFWNTTCSPVSPITAVGVT